ncbi:MFS transporter [Staphylococcus pettenkoferi]|uniref:MFS transporter n=1 Tax=Staphylococcus pettenkoferi TaxID=170573 RepID=UPI0011A3065D|nr:MFS transporter [Staphylococcus pettenkoferi]MCY1597699.1 MFS transporter [Staphylococcus pettenkoferi]
MTALSSKRKQRSLIIGVMLSILTYWLFAQALLNIGPQIQSTYHASLNIVNISVSLTSFVTGVLMVVAGNVADKLERVKMVYLALILNVIGSLLLVLTGYISLFLLGRVIQGFSAAIIMPTTIALFNDYFDGEARKKALSYWSIGAFGGTGFASTFAGLISTYFGWQYIFILSIVISIVAFWLLRDISDRQRQRDTSAHFDLVGLVVFIAMIASISFVITQGYKMGWTHPYSLGCVLVFVVSVVLFIFVEQRRAEPFINLRLFKNKAFVGAVIANTLLNTCVGVIALINIFAQGSLKLNSFQAGLLTLPYVIALLIVVRVGEKGINRFSSKVMMAGGPTLSAIGIALLSMTFLNSSSYLVLVIIASVLFGTGTGLFATPALNTAVSTTPQDKVGVASDIFKMGSTLGGAFGIAIITSVYEGVLSSGKSVSQAASYGFLTGVLMVVIAIIVGGCLLPRKEN